MGINGEEKAESSTEHPSIPHKNSGLCFSMDGETWGFHTCVCLYLLRCNERGASGEQDVERLTFFHVYLRCNKLDMYWTLSTNHLKCVIYVFCFLSALCVHCAVCVLEISSLMCVIFERFQILLFKLASILVREVSPGCELTWENSFSVAPPNRSHKKSRKCSFLFTQKHGTTKCKRRRI